MKEPVKRPYYSFHKIYSFNALFMFIVGARGIGKTYGALKRSIERYLKHGEQFAYVRRYKPEIVASKSTFFAAVSREFPDYEFRVNGNEGQIRHVDDADDSKAWRTINYFITLSTAQSIKGASFANVYTVIFDEFIIEKGHTQYLPNEANVFNNLFLTIDRYQDRVRVLFLANAVSITNPYFIEYDIRPEGKEFITAKGGDIVVHFPDPSDFADSISNSRFGRFIQDTEYADYAIGNEFVDNHDHLIGNKTSSASYLFTLKSAGTYVSIWHDMVAGNVFAQLKRPKKERIYVTAPAEMTGETLLMDRTHSFAKGIRSAFASGKMLFDSPRARNAVLESMKCR